MNYTERDVINLNEDWFDECGEYWHNEGWRFSKSFPDWLRDKNKTPEPKEGDIIWVKEGLLNDQWLEAEFVMFNELGQAECWNVNKTKLIPWDTFILTKP